MSEKERIEYIHNRIWLHQEAQVRYDLETIEHDRFVPCADDERWKKEDSWAVKKKGQKRATRVFDNVDEANQYSSSNSAETEIEHRPGEYTRCKGNYCGVADFCHQYRGDN